LLLKISNKFSFQPTPSQPPAVSKPTSTIPTNDYTIPAIEKSLLEMDCKLLNLQRISSESFSLVEAFLGSTSTTIPTAAPKNNMFNDLHGLESLTVSTSSAPTYIRQYDCLNRITGQGLQVQYRFPRTPYRRAANMVHIELIFTNTTTTKEIQAIKFLKAVCFFNFFNSIFEFFVL
jgi:hypothetical protein